MQIRQNEPTASERTRLFVVRQSDGVTPYTGSLSGSDVQLCKAGAALVNAVGAASLVSSAIGLYKLVLDQASDIDTTGELVMVVSKSGVQTMVLSLGQVVPGDPYRPQFFGTAVTGTLTASSFTTSLTQTAADHWKGAFVRFTSGALTGQVKKVGSYAVTGGVLTLDSGAAFTSAPSNGDTFELITT